VTMILMNLYYYTSSDISVSPVTRTHDHLIPFRHASRCIQLRIHSHPVLIDTLLSYGVPPRIGIEPWVMRGDASIADTRHKIIYGLLRPWNASVPQSLIDHSIIYSEYPIIRR